MRAISLRQGTVRARTVGVQIHSEGGANLEAFLPGNRLNLSLTLLDSGASGILRTCVHCCERGYPLRVGN